MDARLGSTAVTPQGGATPADASAPALRNSFFDALPLPVLEALRPETETVLLPRGSCLMTLARNVPHVYFPLGSLLTVDVARAGAAASHLRVVGSDGMAGGLSMLVGADLPTLSVSVIRGGTSLRVPGAAFREVLAGSADLRRAVRAYTVVLRGNVERWTALPGNAALGAPLLARINDALARQH